MEEDIFNVVLNDTYNHLGINSDERLISKLECLTRLTIDTKITREEEK
jgi:hypothetical protein